jgi:hypothetical protein
MLLLKTPHSIRLRTMILAFERLGFAAAFFFGSLPFFFSAGAASAPGDLSCFSAASACSTT